MPTSGNPSPDPMEPQEHVPPQPVSEVLDHLLATEQQITVGDVFGRVAGRGFGLLMILLGLPMLIPVLPPGASAIVGPIYMLLAFQLAVGFDRPWLPRWLRRRRLSPGTVEGLRRKGVPLVRRLERYSRPRFRVLNNPVMVRAAAVVVLFMGLILLSPAPFLNTLPAIAVMVIGAGLLRDDGLFLLGGSILGVIVLGIFVAAVGLIVAAFDGLVKALKRLVP